MNYLIKIGSLLIIIASVGLTMLIPLMDNQIKQLESQSDTVFYNLGRSEARLNIARDYDGILRVLLEINASGKRINATIDDVKDYYIQAIEAGYFTINHQMPSETQKAEWKSHDANFLVNLNNNYLIQISQLQEKTIEEKTQNVGLRDFLYYLFSVINIFGLLIILVGTTQQDKMQKKTD